MASRVKRRRIVLLAHRDLLPPDDPSKLSDEDYRAIKTEVDVLVGLRELGHEVIPVGVHDELAPLRTAVQETEPHVVFNLLEEFHDQVIYDAHVVGYLELLRAPYTGCNPRGLVIARDKALSKKILAYHRIRVPKFAVVPRHRRPRRPKRMDFPIIVKSLVDEGSKGISQASVVTTDSAFEERVRFVHERVKSDAIAEEFIAGRELYAAVLGNRRFKVFPIWELFFDKLPDDARMIATSKAKWDVEYQQRVGVRVARAVGLSPELERQVARVAKRICRRLGVDGYVRIDFRLTEQGELYFLEANPNPDIALGDEFASAGEAAGFSYAPLLQRIVNLGASRTQFA